MEQVLLLTLLEGKNIPWEALMQKRVMILFDVVVLAGFGAYMAMTIWQLPDELRHRLFATSLGVLAKLTGLAG
jgi:hypothetical protein